MMGARGMILVLTILALWAVPTVAQESDAERGEEIYAKRCIGCHGEEGDGVGAADERLNPPPRDFSLGLYKFKTTAFDDDIPNDGDLVRMIRDGMPGTAMPGWSDVLSEQEILDLVAYIKTFAGLEEEEATIQIDYGSQIASSEGSIAKGRPLFEDRCAECHGKSGKGTATKKLKDDDGARTWPRNLTKPWTFRASNDPKDIFTRATVGIPGTQMPSFADPKSKKMLSIEERWHVANYVASLAKTAEVVRPENTVIEAAKVEGDLPEAPDDPRWDTVAPVSFFLVPQILAKKRLFTPSNDTITLRALYSEEAIALLIEWDDRTNSRPGDPEAAAIADPDIAEDGVAVQFPVEVPGGHGEALLRHGRRRQAGQHLALEGWLDRAAGERHSDERPRLRRDRTARRDGGRGSSQGTVSGWHLAGGHGPAARDRGPGGRRSVHRGPLHTGRLRRLGRLEQRGRLPPHHDYLVLAAARTRGRRPALPGWPGGVFPAVGRRVLVAAPRDPQACRRAEVRRVMSDNRPLSEDTPRKGAGIKLFGVAFIFVGMLDSMLFWRGGFQLDGVYALLIAFGVVLVVLGAIRSE